MSVYEARLRVAHDSEYAKLTADRDIRLDMWCNGHCDLLRATGEDIGAVVEWIRDSVGVDDTFRSGETLLVITGECLKSYQSPLIEQYFEEHGCLWHPPQRYERGQVLIRALALSESRLTDLYQRLVDQYPVVVDSKFRRTQDVLEGMTGVPRAVDFGLTGRQAEALTAAYEKGFYAIPREHTSAEIADELGLSRRTFEEHLRRAEGKVVGELLPIPAE